MVMKGHWGGVTPEPDKYLGFIYLIECRVDGTKYIGKKQYWKARPKAVKCKSKVTDRSSPKWKESCWMEADWQSYTGSSKDFNIHIMKHGKENFVFTILSQHTGKGSLHYAEIEEQVLRDVLRVKMANGQYEYFNRQIAATRFRPPTVHSEATREKISKHWEEFGHPMQGKEHPNKGKKLPQTAPKTHVSVDRIQITDGILNEWWPKSRDIPYGWRVGITKNGYTNSEDANKQRRKNNVVMVEKAKEKYAADPKLCLNCNNPVPYEHKNSWSNCSLECRSEWRSKVSTRINKERKEL